MKIGVVIPTYNRPKLLSKTLKSLQAQTYPNWLAVVVNDASTLSYADVESEFADDLRIRFFVNSVNSGANISLNNGFDELEKHPVDFVTFLDDDDEFAPDYFAAGCEQIKKHPEYGWFISNNYGEHKKSTRDIVVEGDFDWIDDYIYGKIRGDKAYLIASSVLSGVRMDSRFRASHRWPYFIDLGEKTKIYAFPHPSIKKAYLEGGITKNKKKIKSLLDIYSRFYKHYRVIRVRPGKILAYKYFMIELLKAPMRTIRYLVSKTK